MKHRRIIIAVMLFFLMAASWVLAAREKGASSEVQKGLRVPIGLLEDYPVGTIKPFPKDKFIVFSVKDGLYAISTSCTHRGCTVAYKKNRAVFLCPCHGAKFDRQGRVSRGPARQPLKWIALSRDEDGRLFVEPGVPVPPGIRFDFAGFSFLGRVPPCPFKDKGESN